MIAATLLVVIGSFLVLATHVLSRRERIVTPLALFVTIDVVATWPTLTMAADRLERGWTAALLAGCATLAATITYIVCGGLKAPGDKWRSRSSVPSKKSIQQLGAGIFLLTCILVGLSIYRFKGLPPLLHGGLNVLIHPLDNAQQVMAIREARRSMTKGYLIGEQYHGQGLMNAFSEVGWQVAVVGAVFRRSWMHTKASSWQLIGVASLAFIMLGSDGKRSSLALVFLAAIAAVALRHRLSTRKITWGVTAFFALLLLIAPLSKGGDVGGVTVAQRAQAMFSRVTQGNGQNNVQIVELIDSGTMRPGHGSVFLNKTLVMIPGAPSSNPFALEVTRQAYGAGTNTTGFSTPTQFGVLYADGRDLAVILGYIFMGAIMALGWRRVTKIDSYWGAILMVECAVLLGYMAVTGIQGAISNMIMVGVSLGILAVPSVATRNEALTVREPAEVAND